MLKTLAVVGAGPKGAAIAAKAAAMQAAGLGWGPQVTLYEPHAPAAAWRGSHGYTDGEQPLCTLAERDLGFPYDRLGLDDPASADVARIMMQRFSWQAYSVGQGTGESRYDEWVLRGRRPPSHREFAAYLEHAITESQAGIRLEKVMGVDHVRGQWCVTSEDAHGQRFRETYDGLVVSGNGTAWQLPGSKGPGGQPHPQVFDGHDFWLRLPQARQLIAADGDPEVVIIGAGGTAAAIAHWFVRQRIGCVVKVIGREPTLYGRTPSYFADRLFTDSDAWDLLEDHAREAFVRRVTAGIVWEYVLDAIATEQVHYESWDAVQFVPCNGSGPGAPQAVRLEVRPSPAPQGAVPAPRRRSQQLDATLFIDARGFDRSSFLQSLGFAPTLSGLLARSDLASFIGPDLAVALAGIPPGLHLPAYGTHQGPGASNLMALGWVSDRICGAY